MELHRAKLPPVPDIPSSITGRCVYGHIITDEHRDHFRELYPDIEKFQSSTPESLVSVASIIIHPRLCLAATTDLYVNGQWHICLVHIDCRIPGRRRDKRGPYGFMKTVEESLGIAEQPKWYPWYTSSEAKALISGQVSAEVSGH